MERPQGGGGGGGGGGPREPEPEPEPAQDQQRGEGQEQTQQGQARRRTQRQRPSRNRDQYQQQHANQQPGNFPVLLQPIREIDARIGRAQGVIMNKDGHYTHVHLHRARDADLLDQFCRDKLPADDIYVPAQHQPVNPEDEDDVVPDQHAAFGIQRATQARREPAWRDHGLAELMSRGPDAGVWRGSGAGVGGAGAATTRAPSRLPRS